MERQHEVASNEPFVVLGTNLPYRAYLGIAEGLADCSELESDVVGTDQGMGMGDDMVGEVGRGNAIEVCDDVYANVNGIGFGIETHPYPHDDDGGDGVDHRTPHHSHRSDKLLLDSSLVVPTCPVETSKQSSRYRPRIHV